MPAGRKTFEVPFTVNDTIRLETGRGRIAAVGYRNPSWIPGYLRVIDSSRFIFTWDGLGPSMFVRVEEKASPTIVNMSSSECNPIC